MTTCKAHPNHNFYGEPFGTVNYGKPHVPVAGKDGERQRMSCLFCGQWLDKIGGITCGLVNVSIS